MDARQEPRFRLRSLTKEIGVTGESLDRGKDTFTIARDAGSVHVACQRHKAAGCQTACTLFGMFIEATTAMNHKDSGPLTASGLVPRKKTVQISIAVAVVHRLYHHRPPLAI